MSDVSMIGPDLAKNAFQFRAADPSGCAVIRNQLQRGQVFGLWHLAEMGVKINGEMHYLWRAVATRRGSNTSTHDSTIW